MNVARLQNRHLRNYRYARRLTRGRVPQLPKPPGTNSYELPSRESIAASARHAELEAHRSKYRGPTPPPPPRVGDETAGETRLGKCSGSPLFESRHYSPLDGCMLTRDSLALDRRRLGGVT